MVATSANSSNIVSLKNLKKSSIPQIQNNNSSSLENSLPKSEISLSTDPDLVRHLPDGHLREQEEIALVSNVPLSVPRGDLAHNYSILEEERLQRISASDVRIRNQITYYEEVRRMKLHFLEAL